MKKTTNIGIYSQRLAGTLMIKGFVLIDMAPNTNGSGKNVFYFKDSPELQSVILEYKKH